MHETRHKRVYTGLRNISHEAVLSSGIILYHRCRRRRQAGSGEDVHVEAGGGEVDPG